MNEKLFSPGRNILYHFIPGAAILSFYLLLISIFTSPQIPKALLLYVSTLIIIPIAYFIMKKHSPSEKILDAVGYKTKLPIRKVLVFGLIAFVWAGLIFMVGQPISNWLQDNVFWWMKESFDMTGYLAIPAEYPKAMLVLTWAVGLVITSIVIPVIEEFYFRGFLLHRLERLGIAAVFVSALFFSLYHVFSPWMFVVRFVALLPMTFFVWKYKDIRIGILCHVLLNLVGDSVMAIPIVFLP